MFPSLYKLFLASILLKLIHTELQLLGARLKLPGELGRPREVGAAPPARLGIRGHRAHRAVATATTQPGQAGFEQRKKRSWHRMFFFVSCFFLHSMVRVDK